LRRYFESLAIDWIEESGVVELRQSYDQLVEGYVAESLERARFNFINEAKIKKLLLPAQKTVDFLIEESDAVILLEVKNKWLSNSLPASRSPYDLKSKLSATIVKGKAQLEDAEKALSALQRYRHKKFYRIIVTTNDLWLSNAELLTAEADTDSGRYTWLISLQDVDMLCEIMNANTRSLHGILVEYEKCQKNPMISIYSFRKFLEELKENTAKLPMHLLKVADTLIENVRSKLAVPLMEL
jgi:hypothetical protein